MWIAALVVAAVWFAGWLNRQDQRAHEPDPAPVYQPPAVRVIPPVFDQDRP